MQNSDPPKGQPRKRSGTRSEKMNKELFEALDALEKDKGISKDYMI